MRHVFYAALIACGSSSPPAAQPPPHAVAVAPPDAADERAHHDEVTAAHRKIEAEQQDALAATCDAAESHEPHERCLPSCYATEPADVRAGKKLAGAVEIRHLVCERAGAYVVWDEVETLALRPARGRFPKPHKQGTWQATVEAALAAVPPKPPRGDALVVTGTWHDVTHAQTKERLRCVIVSHFTRALHHPLDACGGDGALACEAAGNAAVRGINVVHYRLAEAQHLKAAGKSSECMQAALEAVAVARGMPRWRQYAKLNVRAWVDHAGYKTRFDGVLDEDTLFATAASLGTEAEAVYAACGGDAGAPTTVTQEQSFHTCW